MAPITNEKLLAARMIDSMRNTTDNGTKVYNESDNLGDQAVDVLVHLAGAFVPGTVTSLDKIAKGARGEVSKAGMKYDPFVDLTSAVTGFRTVTIDPRQSLGFDAGDFQREIREATSIFTSLANSRGTVSDDDLAESYAHAEENRRRTYETLKRKLDAAVKLGVPLDEAIGILHERGISESVAQQIAAGTYSPYVPDDLATLQKMLPLATPEHAEMLQGAIQKRVASDVRAATAPGRTTRSREQANAAKQRLIDSGVDKQTVTQAMMQQWLADDQAAATEKLGADAPILTQPMLSPSRVDRLQRLGVLTADQAIDLKERLMRQAWQASDQAAAVKKYGDKAGQVEAPKMTKQRRVALQRLYDGGQSEPEETEDEQQVFGRTSVVSAERLRQRGFEVGAAR